jgi:hypothetical protein
MRRGPDGLARQYSRDIAEVFTLFAERGFTAAYQVVEYMAFVDLRTEYPWTAPTNSIAARRQKQKPQTMIEF